MRILTRAREPALECYGIEKALAIGCRDVSAVVLLLKCGEGERRHAASRVVR